MKRGPKKKTGRNPSSLTTVGRDGKHLFGAVTNLRQRAFLAAYCKIHNIEKAAQAAGVGYASHYSWMRRDPSYEPWFLEAQKIAGDYLEDAAYEWASLGEDTPVTFQGEIRGYWKRKNPQVMTKLLEGVFPERYGQRASFQFTGPTYFTATIEQAGREPVEITTRPDSGGVSSSDYRRERAERDLRDRATRRSKDTDLLDGGDVSRNGEQAAGISNADKMDGGD